MSLKNANIIPWMVRIRTMKKYWQWAKHAQLYSALLQALKEHLSARVLNSEGLNFSVCSSLL